MDEIWSTTRIYLQILGATFTLNLQKHSTFKNFNAENIMKKFFTIVSWLSFFAVLGLGPSGISFSLKHFKYEIGWKIMISSHVLEWGFSFWGAMGPQNLQVDVQKMYDRSQSGSLSCVNFSLLQTDMSYSGISNSIRKKSRRSRRKRQHKRSLDISILKHFRF